MKKKIWLPILSVVLQFMLLICVRHFNQFFLPTFPLWVKLILITAVMWVFMIVPIVFSIIQNKNMNDLGFRKDKIWFQILIGVGLSLVFSLVFTILPILFGFGDSFVGGKPYKYAWQFAYEFVYAIIGVGLWEEVFFRGYLYSSLLDIKNSKWFAIIVSSVIFGFAHVDIFNFSLINFLQVGLTFIIGFLFCLCRDKVKNCSTLSLILIHGVYDASITLLVFLL